MDIFGLSTELLLFLIGAVAGVISFFFGRSTANRKHRVDELKKELKARDLKKSVTSEVKEMSDEEILDLLRGSDRSE